MTQEIKITPPEGYEIDRENSTFECIKFKSITRRFRDGNKEVHGYRLDPSHIIPAQGFVSANNHDIFYNYKQAKSAKAMAIISQIMANDSRFGGVVTDEEYANKNIWKYSINRRCNTIEKYSGLSTCVSWFLLEEVDADNLIDWSSDIDTKPKYDKIYSKK